MLVIVLKIGGAPAVARYLYSFTDAKLVENRIKNLFHIDHADHFPHGAQSLIKIDCNVFLRYPLAQC